MGVDLPKGARQKKIEDQAFTLVKSQILDQGF